MPTTTLSSHSKVATGINVFTLPPERQKALFDTLDAVNHEILTHKFPMNISSNFHRGIDASIVINYNQYTDRASGQYLRTRPETAPLLKRTHDLCDKDRDSLVRGGRNRHGRWREGRHGNLGVSRHSGRHRHIHGPTGTAGRLSRAARAVRPVAQERQGAGLCRDRGPSRLSSRARRVLRTVGQRRRLPAGDAAGAGRRIAESDFARRRTPRNCISTTSCA